MRRPVLQPPGWVSERPRQDNLEHPGEPPEEASHGPGEQGGPERAKYRRHSHRGTRESTCPMPGCRCRTRKMRDHVTLVHLYPLFLREVPCAPEITRARKAVLDWIRLRLLGPRTSLLELSAKVPTQEVFTCPAPIPNDIIEAMDALCLEVGEEPPYTYTLAGELHPALLLHWRVQAYLVGYLDPDSQREYQGLLPGLRVNGRPLRSFTMNPGQHPQVRSVIVVEGWTPEVPSDFPPKEAAEEEDTPPAAAGESAQEPEGAQAPPPENQEDAWGANLPPGSLSGGMITFDMRPMALGPRQVHLALMYEW